MCLIEEIAKVGEQAKLVDYNAGIEYATYKNKTTRELYTFGKLNHVRYDKNFDFF